jgi:3-deoxy-D-manno-octulosonic-acid transferase
VPTSPKSDACKRIWIHAASVGEVMASEPVIKAYKELYPEDEIVMSVITPGGFDVAQRLKGKLLMEALYAPFDLPFAVKRFIKAIKPDELVILETEIWPNLLHLTRSSGARICLINGRISDKSLPRYRHFKWFIRWALSHFDRILVQTETDLSRYLELGACKERTQVAGNAKFDQISEPLNEEARMELMREFHLSPGTPVLVVGSTRTAEEESGILDAYARLLEEIPDLVFIHAPRHIERSEEIAAFMRSRGLEPVMRTELKETLHPPKQIILNSFGELANVYALADVAFVGNSMLPPGGGQSPLQPLAQGTPTLFGPYMTNFRDIVAMMKSSQTGWEVRDANELFSKAMQIIRDNELKTRIRSDGPALIRKNRGASRIYAQTMAELLDKTNSNPQ